MMNEMRELIGDKVRITTIRDVDRYSVIVIHDCSEECNMVIEELKDCCKFCVMVNDYRSLTNVDLDEDNIFTKTSLSLDLKRYQKFLDDEYGKGEYEAFVLGAYIHSGTSFSISKEGDHRCRFDSGQLGFIGVPTDTGAIHNVSNLNFIARRLTAAYNGEFVEYQIIDELTSDVVDSTCDFDYETITKWKESASKKYGVTFDE